MGKTTFRRLVSAAHHNYLISIMPVIGGWLFLVGSYYFLPAVIEKPCEPLDTLEEMAEGRDIAGMLQGGRRGTGCSDLPQGSLCMLPHHNATNVTISGQPAMCEALLFHEEDEEIGAILFIIGSVLYFVAPFLDFIEMCTNLENLKDGVHYRTVFEIKQLDLSKKYEHLYKSWIAKVQRCNALIYNSAGVTFIIGSVLFLPTNKEYQAQTFLRDKDPGSWPTRGRHPSSRPMRGWSAWCLSPLQSWEQQAQTPK